MNNKQLKIKQNITLAYLNELYQKLEKFSNENLLDLVLPTKITHKDFSVFPSFLQFIATWVRQPNSGNLYLPITEFKNLEEYLDQEFVYPIVVLSWEKKIFNTEGKNIKSLLKGLSKDYFSRMEYLKLKQNDSVPIYCFDHDLSKRGYSRFFYNSDKSLVSEEELDFNLYPVFKKVGSFNKGVFQNSIKNKIDDFSKITHELFFNTDEHARTDIDFQNLYPNIRAAYFRFQKRKLNSYLNQYKDSNTLYKYLNSNLPLNENSEVYFLEISILDSGPGLARRYGNITDLNSISINREVELIKECLYKHNTSSVGIRKERKGLGLDRVLKTISGKGFLRIKSGRVDVIRDMRNKPYVRSENSVGIKLTDWNNSDNTFSEHPECSGSLISLIYPLGNE